MTPYRLPGLLFVILAIFSANARAQNEPPDDRNIEIQLFEPALGSHAFLTVAGAEVMTKGQFQLALGVNYFTHPFSVFIVDNDNALTRNADVVSSIFAGNLSFAYGLTNAVQLGVVLPAILSMQGDGLNAATGMPEAGGLSVRGLGDARIEAIWRVYTRSRSALAVIPAVTLPTSVKLGSDDEAFLGDNLPSFRPRVAWEWDSPSGKLSAGANLGLILRKVRTVYSSDVGQQLTYGAAAALHATRRVDLVAELFGRKGFASDLDESPLEIDGAVKLQPATALALMAGGGAGLVKGVGAPSFRIFAAVSWTPDYRDNDRDGIANMNDRCPNAPEDKDGTQDDDGCPDLDNDGDGVADDADKCPTAKEDLDGFQDEDGCPDTDNDGDGIPDDKDGCPEDAEDKLPPRADDGCPQSKGDNDGDGVSDDKDKCPTDYEDMDGYQDDDGCPDNDNDNDGILDKDDKCPMEAEDKDGFQDEDGCADKDNDNDGVADKKDKCPNEPETINGVKDDDGCPDKGGKVLASLQGDTMVLDAPIAFDGKRPRSKARPVLDQVALVMKARSDVIKWRITTSASKMAVAQGRGDELKAFLVKKGVPAGNIDLEAAEGADALTIKAAATADGKPLPAGPAPAPGEPEQPIEIEPTPQ